jgi:hypothetical protein
MYPTSDSETLTSEQTALLDKTFFESNPVSYWRARIDDLLRGPMTPIDYGVGLAAQVVGYGIDERLLPLTQPTEPERELQKALDAFALRHHLAESLVRLVHAVLIEVDSSNSGFWASLTRSPSQAFDVVKAIREFEARGVVPATLFMPTADVRALPPEPPADVVAAVQMHWRWVRRSMQLLVSEGLESNVGNNKLKHGLAVRQHDQLRVGFMTESPTPEGNIRLTDVRNGLGVIDARAVEFLQCLPKRDDHAGSWEVTVLNLRPAPLIAEALMLCTVWSSVFASAAADRFAGSAEAISRHPGLALGPPPEALIQDVTGYRQALTMSTKSGTSRGFVVETPEGVVGIDVTGPKIDGVIIDG